MEDQCVAIKSSDGVKCSKKHAPNKTRCNMHQKIVERDGPNYTELCELAYIFKTRRKNLNRIFSNQVTALGPQGWINNGEAYNNLDRQHRQRIAQLAIDERTEYNAIRTRQQEDIIRTGINPDAAQDAAREAARRERLEARQRMIAEWQARQAERVAEIQRNAPVQPVPRQGLAGFAHDRQNVHTTVAVKQTLKVITEIMKIDVPLEYRWNTKTVSKTMPEIISECNLSPASAWQMVSKYCSDEQIYDLTPGIYGKVLDSVWQYIKNSPDKEDLKKILKSEMNDNIGMCAQGNLSRLTNILAGYLDCVTVEESMTDKLGRLLPPLMEIEDIAKRLIAAARIFIEVELPENQWESWGQGLLDDQEDDDYREMYIHDGIIEFVVFT